jgi:hypothetical protein
MTANALPRAWLTETTRSQSPHTRRVGINNFGRAFSRICLCPFGATWARRAARVVSRNPGSWARRYCSASHDCGARVGLANSSGIRTRTRCAAPMAVRPHQIAASPTPGRVICRRAGLTSRPSPALPIKHSADTRSGVCSATRRAARPPSELPTKTESPNCNVSRNAHEPLKGFW